MTARTLMRWTLPLAAAAALLACGPGAEQEETMDRIAEGFVRLSLAVGVHDPDYVDAYLGPEEWRREAEEEALDLAAIAVRSRQLVGELRGLEPPEDEMLEARRRHLQASFAALEARVAQLGGEEMSFDEESRALYDAVAPHHDEEQFRAVLARLEEALPGEGDLTGRYAAFRADLVIPPERLDAVFEAAIAACRERTEAALELPAGESFRVEYVTDQPWSGYNWYQGGYASLIQVNTDLPIHIDRAIDLACHEGYPGHHVYNLLVERELVEGRGWLEFTIYPLFSPRSLIAEGTANFGIEVAFPGDQRLTFERDVLFPLAGLDPARAEPYARVRRATEELSYAGNEAARRYLDGEIGGDEAVEWLMTYSLMTRERAEQRLDFIERYRSYVINYNLGEDLVREYVVAQGGTAENAEERWRIFAELLSRPVLPSELVGE